MTDTFPTLKVALLGCGVVGSEVARLLTEQADDLAPGDLLAVAATGAYCRSLASNYNQVPRPGVVAVADGAEPALIVRRETLDDLLRLDIG